MARKLFLQTFLHSPSQVGSIIPSSTFMVNRVKELVERRNPASLAEFGAGTGVITRGLDQYCEESDAELLIFEKDNRLRDYLQEQFPHRQIFTDALHLPQVLEQQGKKEIDCIVCGLPFTLFPLELRKQIFDLIYASLADHGVLIMYQYSWHMRRTLKERFNSVEIKFVPFNIPPAFLYYCQK